MLFLCCVFSLSCVIAHARSVRASPNRGVGLLSGFSPSLFLVSEHGSVFGNLGRTCGCLGIMMVEDHVFI